MNVYQEHSSSEDRSESSSDQRPGHASVAESKPAVPVSQNNHQPPVQKEEGSEEELAQGKLLPIQTKEYAPLQLKRNEGVTAFKPIQLAENKTGLPDNLKTGVEHLSGMNLSDVKVHYNSSQPAQYKALAYAQGSEIHVAPGQEQHLPHEAWHVAQQKQGRVPATTQMKGVDVNDNAALENEADTMGGRALNMTADAFASGYEHISKADIGDVKAKASLVSTAQRQTLENINSEVAVSRKKINNSNNSSVQKQTVTQLIAGKFLVDDGEPLNEGQIHKSSFLASLRGEVQKIAKEILEPVGLAQNDCPDLNYWISFYSAKDVAYFEAAIARYAPGTAEATNSDEYLAQLTERVKEGLVHHVESGGDNTFDPEPVPADVEAKRPSRSLLQKKDAPIQFGCCSEADPKTDTPEDLYADIKRIAEIKKVPDQLKAFIKLYHDAGIALDGHVADLKFEGYPDNFYEPLTEKDAGNKDKQELHVNMNKIKNSLRECGGTQIMILSQFFGMGDEKSTDPNLVKGGEDISREVNAESDEKTNEVQAGQIRLDAPGAKGDVDAKLDLAIKAINEKEKSDLEKTIDDEKKTEEIKNKAREKRDKERKKVAQWDKVPHQTSAAFIAAMTPGKVAPFSAQDSKTKQNHAFTVASASEAQNRFFLFQGWVEKYSVLEGDYSKDFNTGEFAAFVTAMVTNGAGTYFHVPLHKEHIYYNTYDLPTLAARTKMKADTKKAMKAKDKADAAAKAARAKADAKAKSH